MWAHSILVGVLVWAEKKLKKDRIGPAVEKVVEMVTESGRNGNRLEKNSLLEIEA